MLQISHSKWFIACVVIGLAGGLSSARADGCGCGVCDFDGDRDVDQSDFGHLQSCYTPGVEGPADDCFDADLDGDGRVGQDDFDLFRGCMSGADNPAAGGPMDGLLITEFMASNASVLADEDGDYPDWIEIHNPCRPQVNFAGWYLTDDPANLTKWQFPAVALGRGGFLVVFASEKDRVDPAGRLHTDFRLEGGGEFLALVRPDGQTIEHAYQPEYVEQLMNISYGMNQSATKVVAARSAARYRVPAAADANMGTGWTEPDYPDASWSSATTGLGFSSIPAVFDVALYKSTVQVGSLATAESVLVNPSQHQYVNRVTAPYINYFNTGGAGNFAADQPFPGTQIGTDLEDFIVLVTGTVLIPEAGEWTFGVNSDDGFSLKLTRGAQTFQSSYPSPRGPADTLAVFNLTESGPYDVRLLFYERGGGSELEFFAAKGFYSVFDANAFRLVGDVANGGLPIGVLGGDIDTDISAAMHKVNASLWVRQAFEVTDPAAVNLMSLRIKYEDGFIAYLNGHEVARRNAPLAPSWNSAASSDRPLPPILEYEEISLSGFIKYLRAGKNVLAIHAMNDAAGDGDFVILPEMVIGTYGSAPLYFARPTPGTFNTSGSLDFARDVVFSEPHGFRGAPFQLGMSTPTPGAQIRYTLDGTTPTATTGLVYSGPVNITRTSVVRAAAFRPGYLASRVTTSTYLFVNDVIAQSPNGEPPGPGWPGTNVNGQMINYGMDPNVVNDPRYAALMDDALLSIPSISMVTDLANLFDPATGIYVNAYGEGRAWERPASLELLNPDGSPGFQIDAGIRIRGGYSRQAGNPKHAFRFFFRSEYGSGKLHFPLFGDEGADEFDHVDLRTAQNYSWSLHGDSSNIMCREVFSRDTQRDMGQAYTRSRYYHLFINGHYWGLFQTQERSEADYAATYFGGDPDDYDVVKAEAGPYITVATDGNLDAWYRLWQIVEAGVNDETYNRLQGLNPDGTRNYDYEVLVDADNLIDYMFCTFYVGDPDGPLVGSGTNPNNFFGLRHRNGQSGFKFFRHDAEHSLRDLNGNRTGPYPAGQEFQHFNPQRVHQQLVSSPEYRMRFADRTYKHLSKGGALSVQAGIDRFRKRATEIDLAIIGESARWGDAKTEPARNRNDHWLPAINWVIDSYLPARGAIVLGQLRAKGWYPSISPPVFSHEGGNVPAGLEVMLSMPTGGSGTLYYTLDGSDPRLPGGAVSPSARVYEAGVSTVTLVPRGSVWWYKDDGVDPGPTWKTRDYNHAAWPSGPAKLGYNNGGEQTLVRCNTSPTCAANYSPKYPTTYFRTTFDLPEGVVFSGFQLGVVRDDAAAVYINGGGALKFSMPGTWNHNTYTEDYCAGGADESTFFPMDLTPGEVTLYAGTNSVAVEVHQCNAGSSDLSFDLELIGTQTTVVSEPIIINDNTRLRARILKGAEWSALAEATYLVGPAPVYVNEVMATNSAFLEDPVEPGEFPDWFELYNPNPFDMDLSGMYLTDKPDNPDINSRWKIPNGVVIPRGGVLLFWADDDGTQGRTHVGFKLDGGDGEAVALFDRDGATLIDEIRFGPQTADVSIGRYPDGAGESGTMSRPTPGEPNAVPGGG